MGKDIGRIYKYRQSQLSTSSLNAPVSSSSDKQTSSAIKSTTMYVTSIKEKNQNHYVLYSQNTIQNDASITNNDNMQSFETEENKNHSIPTNSNPNHHAQIFATISSSILNLNTPTILPPVGK